MLDKRLEYISRTHQPSSLSFNTKKSFTEITLWIRSMVNLSMADIDEFSDALTTRSPSVRMIGKTNSSIV